MTGADFKMWAIIGLAYLAFLAIAGVIVHLFNKNQSNDDAGCAIAFLPPIAFYAYFLWRGWNDNEHVAMLFASPIVPTLACTITTLLILASAKSWQSSDKKLQNEALWTAIAIVGISAFLIQEYADKTLKDLTSTESATEVNASAGAQPQPNNSVRAIVDQPLGRTRNQQNWQYDAMLDQLEAKHSPANPRSSNFSPEFVRRLENSIAFYERQGVPGPIALQRSARELSGVQLVIPAPAKEQLNTEPRSAAAADAAADAAEAAADAAAASANATYSAATSSDEARLQAQLIQAQKRNAKSQRSPRQATSYRGPTCPEGGELSSDGFTCCVGPRTVEHADGSATLYQSKCYSARQ